jgi:hypothetical protein
MLCPDCHQYLGMGVHPQPPGPTSCQAQAEWHACSMVDAHGFSACHSGQLPMRLSTRMWLGAHVSLAHPSWSGSTRFPGLSPGVYTCVSLVHPGADRSPASGGWKSCPRGLQQVTTGVEPLKLRLPLAQTPVVFQPFPRPTCSTGPSFAGSPT